MKKLLWYSYDPLSPSGVGKSTFELLSRLEGWDITILAPMHDLTRPLPLFKNTTLISCNKPKGVSYIQQQLNPDITVAYGPMDWIAQVLQSRTKEDDQSPLIVYMTIEHEPLVESLIVYLHQSHFEKLLVPSGWNQDVLKQHSIESIVLPLGVDHDRYSPDPQSKNGFTYGFMGGRRKPEHLLTAFEQLPYDNVRLLLDKEHGYTDDRIIDCPYAANGVPLPEEVIPARYNQFDVHIFPTNGEGFGLPMVEAAACGIPQIVTDLPITREILGDAAIYINLNAREMLKAMLDLYYNEDLRIRLSEKGQERVKRYCWNKSATDLQQIIEQVI